MVTIVNALICYNKCIMETKFRTGEKVYLINESHAVEEATVVVTISGFVTVRFTEREWGERVRESRLYATREEAEAAVRG